MKKFSVIMIGLAMSIVACQKETMNPADNQQAVPKMQEQFSNSQTVTVYDESGKYSIDLWIRCNDKNAFDKEIEIANSRQLVLRHKAREKTISSNSNSLLNKPSEPISEDVLKNAVYTTFQNIKIGDATGFELKSKYNAKIASLHTDYAMVNVPKIYDYPNSTWYLTVTHLGGPTVNVNIFKDTNTPNPGWNHFYQGYLYIGGTIDLSGYAGFYTTRVILGLTGSNPPNAFAVVKLEADF